MLISVLSFLSPLIVVSLFTVFIYVFIYILRMMLSTFRNNQEQNNVLAKMKKLIPVFIYVVFALISLKLMSVIVLGSAENILDSESVVVSVNGAEIEGAAKTNFIIDFKRFNYSKVKAGSRPTDTYSVVISDSGSQLVFEFKRDSREEHLYWVYFPKFFLKSRVGFVRTSQLE